MCVVLSNLDFVSSDFGTISKKNMTHFTNKRKIKIEHFYTHQIDEIPSISKKIDRQNSRLPAGETKTMSWRWHKLCWMMTTYSLFLFYVLSLSLSSQHKTKWMEVVSGEEREQRTNPMNERNRFIVTSSSPSSSSVAHSSPSVSQCGGCSVGPRLLVRSWSPVVLSVLFFYL